MKKKGKCLAAALLAATISMTTMVGCGNTKKEASIEEIEKNTVSTGISCHDPQIVIGSDNNYYMFGSHMVAAQSSDLKNWEYFANGSSLFSNLFSGNLDAFSFVGKNSDGDYSVWASDVIYNETMGKYVMYFSTTSSYIKSNLCMAVADEITGPYSYVDNILYSGFGKSDAEETNIYSVLGENADISRYLQYGGYNNEEWPNCIDPAVFTDEDGRMWMTYGSWSGGIFLLEINQETGYPIYPEAGDNVDPYYGVHLIGGGHHAVEGPYIEYDKESGYYYLFASYGDLQSDGGYQIRQFRSENVDGPYVDAAGQTMENQDDYYNYGLKMMGNYTLPSLSSTYMAPGGQSTFANEEGQFFITYHQRFDDGEEYHEPRIHQMFQTKDGWFVAAPFETNGETLKEEGYQQSDLEGTFYLLNHGTDVSDRIMEAEEVTLKSGNITGSDISGSYQVEDKTDYVSLTVNEETYEGVIVEMEDEAGNLALCICAAGENNETIWAVQYLKEDTK